MLPMSNLAISFAGRLFSDNSSPERQSCSGKTMGFGVQ